MTVIPGADELRIRSILRTKGVGPDAAWAPGLPGRERDWLDDILDSNTPEPEPAEEAAEPEPGPERPAGPAPAPKKPKAKGKTRARRSAKPRDPAAPRAAFDNRPEDPRQSLLDAYDRIPTRLKWLAYHASAAYAGWTIGWVTWTTNTTAWITAGHAADMQSIACYTAAIGAVLAYRRTRRWWWPVSWLAAVPASSTVVGVLLYGTGYHH